MKTRILQGLLSGLLSNLIGIVICIAILGAVKDMGFLDTFSFFKTNGTLWMILAMGALPNLLVFFAFLKKDWEYRARGVLMATFITAITAYLIYFF